MNEFTENSQSGGHTHHTCQSSKKLQEQYLLLIFCSIIFKRKVCPWVPPPLAHTRATKPSPFLPETLLNPSAWALSWVGEGVGHTHIFSASSLLELSYSAPLMCTRPCRGLLVVTSTCTVIHVPWPCHLGFSQNGYIQFTMVKEARNVFTNQKLTLITKPRTSFHTWDLFCLEIVYL
jgi:hypothetical protein